MVKTDVSEKGYETDAIREIVRSLKLTAKIHVTETGKVYRVASFLEPQLGIEMQDRKKPELMGSCEFTNEFYS